MILVYSNKVTNRLEYVCGLLLGGLLGVEWQLTNDTKRFLKHEGPRINYSATKLKTEAVHITPHGFLQERGVHFFQPELIWKDGLPLLFPSATNTDPGFDVFSAAFYLVSRYEEHLPHKKDRFGRFEASESFAFKHNFLQKPVVNHYALVLKNHLSKLHPGYSFALPVFSFVPTYDIDVAYAYKGRGLFRTLLGSLRSLMQFNFKSLAERYRVLTGRIKDPWDTYDYQLALYKETGIKAFYFFLCGDFGHYDKNIAFYSTALFSLVKRVGDYAHVGLHPSFASNDDHNLLGIEASRLSKLINQDIRFSRQHYLKLQIPRTYHNLLKENFSHDFSMGYASQPGFRASICSPFNFYDLDSESITPLIILPTAVMDSTLASYLKLSPKKSFGIISTLIDEVSTTGGTFVSLWHNDTLCDCRQWKGWRGLYTKMFRLAAERHQKNYDPLRTT